MSGEPGPRSSCTFSSPKKKRTKSGPLRSNEKELVINVFKHVEETWPKDSYPYKSDIINKSAEILGISRDTVYRLVNKEMPTVDKVLHAENTDETLPNFKRTSFFKSEGRTIYYTDETWINEGHTMNKIWQDHTIKTMKEAHRD
ncbi:hypothetical protein evm_013474 [Chilo suppressalis]|nr:hypothetical protein evm_013474 [Chilo suppressalis]